MKSTALFLCFFLVFGGVNKAQQKKEAENPYIQLGEKALMDGNFKSAVVHLEKALQTDANNPDILYALGYSYYQSGNYSKSVSVFSKVVSLRPQSVSAYSYRGKARNILGTQSNTPYSEREKLLLASIRDFSKAIELNNNEIPYYQNRAIAYRDYAILKEQKAGGIYDKAASENAYKACINDLQHILDKNPNRKDIADEMKKAKVYMANLNNK